MKHLFKSAAIVAASLLLAVNFSSCNKDPQPTTEEVNKAQKEAIVKQYLNHTVYPTYTSLAEKTEKLVENLETLKANKTQANVNAATVTFLEARKWWEMSEAFLFGAASDFGIDPHIDSWPLDEDAFNNLMRPAWLPRYRIHPLPRRRASQRERHQQRHDDLCVGRLARPAQPLFPT